VADDLTELSAQVGAQLKRRGWMLTLAESCTGGGIAEVVTSVAGSSAWFDRGFVTYSNASKIEMLGVSAQTLATCGAVSGEVVGEMARGALKHSAAQVAIAVSGIAGPDGGTPEKPVGTVWLAWALSTDYLHAERQCFNGDRQSVRQQSIECALNTLLSLLKKQ